MYMFNDLFTCSAKIKLLLSAAKPDKSAGPSNIKKHDYIQLSFRKGGQDQVQWFITNKIL